MIVVTGGAGFIGSNVVHSLNAAGRHDVLVVDDLGRSEKFSNLVGADVADYVDKRAFLDLLAGRSGRVPRFDAIVHQGACSSTAEPDGRYVIENNYEYSKRVLEHCVAAGVPLVYASSAAVYGTASQCSEDPEHEFPLNVYGFSKLLFDRTVRRVVPSVSAPIVGLRYFNVYGPGEEHKGSMSSMVRTLDDQLRATGRVRLFGASHGCAAGEQRRDFIHVDDVVAVIRWFLEHPGASGIFNCGTGRSRTFNELAGEVLRFRGHGVVDHVAFPEGLASRYQWRTCADLTRLRRVGYDGGFMAIEEGIPRYLEGRGGP